MMFGVLFLTQFQQLTVAGFNMFAIRIIELAAFARVVARSEFSFKNLAKVDKAFIGFLLFTTVVYIMRTRQDLSYRVGVSVDAFFCYFAFRGLIRSPAEFRQFLRASLVLLVPFALMVLYESLARRNLLDFLGARAGGGDFVRGGRLRANGSFRHPSLLGTLGATFLPLYIGLAFTREMRFFALTGIFTSLAIVFASNSGGPATCVLVGAVGWLVWRFRGLLNWIRRGIVALTILLIFVMEAPIWYLAARISSVVGGTGYHRARLMDRAFTEIGEWWLAGMPAEKTIDWFPYYIHANNAADITNQFVAYGITAGIGAIALFVYLLVLAFGALGQALRAPTVASKGDTGLIWGLGVMLLVHVFNWIGITYFDQTYVVWYLQFAAVVGVSLAYSQGTSAHSETVLLNQQHVKEEASAVP
jgi:hypothetical protein